MTRRRKMLKPKRPVVQAYYEIWGSEADPAIRETLRRMKSLGYNARAVDIERDFQQSQHIGDLQTTMP